MLFAAFNFFHQMGPSLRLPDHPISKLPTIVFPPPCACAPSTLVFRAERGVGPACSAVSGVCAACWSRGTSGSCVTSRTRVKASKGEKFLREFSERYPTRKCNYHDYFHSSYGMLRQCDLCWWI